MIANSRLTRILPWVIVMQTFSSTELRGQQIREDLPRWRARCSAAVSAIEQRRSGAGAIQALSTLGHNCERSAGPALSAVWSTPPTGRDEIKALMRASGGVKDQRIMDAVLGKASDPDAPADLRIAALTVLASYIDPSVAELREASSWEIPQQRFTIYRSTHAYQVQGTLPLEQGYVTTILDRFAEIAAADPDERVAAAAAFLRTRLES